MVWVVNALSFRELIEVLDSSQGMEGYVREMAANPAGNWEEAELLNQLHSYQAAVGEKWWVFVRAGLDLDWISTSVAEHGKQGALDLAMAVLALEGRVP